MIAAWSHGHCERSEAIPNSQIVAGQHTLSCLPIRDKQPPALRAPPPKWIIDSRYTPPRPSAPPPKWGEIRNMKVNSIRGASNFILANIFALFLANIFAIPPCLLRRRSPKKTFPTAENDSQAFFSVVDAVC